MSNTQIIRIPILPLGLVNAHLIVGEKGAVLVDAGLPDSERQVRRVLAKRGLTFRDIRLIVITHAHIDHAGNALRLKQLTGAPIVAHEGDLPYYRRQRSMTYCATGWFGRLFLKTGLMHAPFEPFEPDILLSGSQTLNLDEWGVKGRVRPTPGHTGGSLSIELADHQMLVGDLLASGILLGGLLFTDRPKKPPFEDDPVRVAESLERMLTEGGRLFYMGHGGPLSAAQVKRHVLDLTKEGHDKGHGQLGISE